eukprot:scaffold66116_cov27-Phaeocystis_antarctica.AAC.1
MSGRRCTLDAEKRTSLAAELCTRCTGAPSSDALYLAMSSAPRPCVRVRVRVRVSGQWEGEVAV